MSNVCLNDTAYDPCRMVSVVSTERVRISLEDHAVGMRLVLRHLLSRREYAFLCYTAEDQQKMVVSDYKVLGDLKGLKVGNNNRGQLFWQKYEYPDGWVTARYMFPDEQDAYEAAVVMGANLSTFSADI